jgi:putative ABC transport system substrate-binding protein
MADFARDGALVAYGLDIGRQIGETAGYIDKLLHGAKPAELPVQQPTNFDLTINLKMAKALGLNVPASIMLQASEVIE